jgi:hypothetical protein
MRLIIGADKGILKIGIRKERWILDSYVWGIVWMFVMMIIFGEGGLLKIILSIVRMKIALT